MSRIFVVYQWICFSGGGGRASLVVGRGGLGFNAAPKPSRSAILWSIERPGRFVARVVGRVGHHSFVSTSTYVKAPVNTKLTSITFDLILSCRYSSTSLTHVVVRPLYVRMLHLYVRGSKKP